jgi:hypothetical protein
MYLIGEEVYRIMQAVGKSRSLLSIHLTGNLYEDKVLRSKIRDIMKPRKRIPAAGEEDSEIDYDGISSVNNTLSRRNSSI